VSDGTIGRWPRDNPVLVLAFFAVLLPLCALTYRYIEAPSQAWGRKLARRVDRSRQRAPAEPVRPKKPQVRPENPADPETEAATEAQAEAETHAPA